MQPTFSLMSIASLRRLKIQRSYLPSIPAIYSYHETWNLVWSTDLLDFVRKKDEFRVADSFSITTFDGVGFLSKVCPLKLKSDGDSE